MFKFKKEIEITKIFSVAMILIASMVSMSFFNLYYIINTQKEYAYLINLSGMQRMNTQKLYYLLEHVLHEPSKSHYEKLSSHLHVMKSDYLWLTQILKKIEFESHIIYTTGYEQTPFKDIYEPSTWLKNGDIEYQTIVKILENHSKMIEILNEAVLKIEQKSNEINSSMISRGAVLLIVNLLILAFVSMVIFRPLLISLRRKNEHISQLNTKLEQKVQERTIHLEKTLNIINQYVYSTHTDKNGVITYVTDAFCELSGYSKEELLGHTHRIIKHPDNPSSAFEPLWNTLLSGQSYKGSVKNRRKNGEDFWLESYIVPDIDEDGEIVGFQAFRQNITDKKSLEFLNAKLEEKVKERTLEIEKMAITDPLTGLYNRHRFNTDIKEAISLHKRYDHFPIVLAIVDIDHFKAINDTYGHNVGDDVLKHFGKLLSQNVRESDKLARWGGEEFVILFMNTDLEHAFKISNQLIEKVRHYKFDVAGDITCSVGLTMLHHQDSAELALERADRALYHAKTNGRDQVCS